MFVAMTTGIRHTSRPNWVLAFLASVVAVLGTLIGAAPASATTAYASQDTVGATVFGAAPAEAATAHYTYDTIGYAYDGPALLSLPDTVATNARGSALGPRVEPGVGHVSLGGFGVAANTAERTVAMGRNMTDRVIPYAAKNGYDWYGGTPSWVPRSGIEGISPRALERTDLWFNQRWIRGEMGGGSRIVDIGEPAGYPPSGFYDMERQQVSGFWNYVKDIQP